MNTITARRAASPVLGLSGCQNIFKEPKSFYTSKKVRKSLEGLSGCQNIFKEPKSFYTPKKVQKSLEGLAGCQNIFKEPRVTYVPKSRKTCSQCGGVGHNKRTCKVITCPPCATLPDIQTILIKEKCNVLLTRSSSAP